MILSKHPNPTFSYYLEERIKAIDSIPVHVKGLDDSLQDVDPRGLFVVICRYIKPAQLAWLEKKRNELAGVALFIDDDIASVFVGNEANWFYKFRLFRLAIWPVRRLNRILSEVWVSTDGLAKALPQGGAATRILPPFPPRYGPNRQERKPDGNTLTMIYHATGVHRLEHEFLVPIVKVALERHPNLNFEVFSDRKIAQLWHEAGIAEGRITVRTALPWIDYLKETSLQEVDIALVPLLDGRTNSSRSGTKRIDVSRCGAAAIFSHCAVYQRHAVDGELHVKNTEGAWLQAIDALALDAGRRARARQATALSVEKMRDATSLALPALSLHAANDEKTTYR